MPRRLPDDVRLDALDSCHRSNGTMNAIGDHALHRAPRRGERVRDARDRPVDLDSIHETERYDVESELWIDHRGEGGPDRIDERVMMCCRHRYSRARVTENLASHPRLGRDSCHTGLDQRMVWRR